MTNVSIPEVNVLNRPTLAVSVPINLSIKFGSVSVNSVRETYFVDALVGPISKQTFESFLILLISLF